MIIIRLRRNNSLEDRMSMYGIAQILLKLAC